MQTLLEKHSCPARDRAKPQRAALARLHQKATLKIARLIGRIGQYGRRCQSEERRGDENFDALLHCLNSNCWEFMIIFQRLTVSILRVQIGYIVLPLQKLNNPLRISQ